MTSFLNGLKFLFEHFKLAFSGHGVRFVVLAGIGKVLYALANFVNLLPYVGSVSVRFLTKRVCVAGIFIIGHGGYGVTCGIPML